MSELVWGQCPVLDAQPLAPMPLFVYEWTATSHSLTIDGCRTAVIVDADRGADVRIELSTPTDAPLAVRVTCDVDGANPAANSGQIGAEFKVDNAGTAVVGRIVANKGFGKGRR